VQLSLSRISYFKQLESYYTTELGESVSGGFCRLFSEKQQELTKILGLATSVSSLFDAEFDTIKSIFAELIDQLSNSSLQRLDNVISSIQGNILLAGNFPDILFKRILRTKTLFEPGSISQYKTAIEQMIDQFKSGYPELTDDLLSFVMFRLCKMIDNVELTLTKPVDDIIQITSIAEREQTRLTSYSNIRTSSAIQGGALRMDPFRILEVRRAAAQNYNGTSSEAGGVSPSSHLTIPFSEEEYQLLNSISENGNQYIQFAPQVINMHAGVSDANVGDGWKKVSSELYLRLFRVARRMNTRLYINSGYRSPQYNARIDGAAQSFHMTGKATDISMTNGLDNSQSTRNQFIKIASQEGLLGIGTYSTFIHVDIGNRRTWGSQNSEALAIHAQDKFRTGQSMNPSYRSTAQ
jgi:hypothetical protein